jgi:formylglycine-generating enzyme required for sulfatase activity
MEDDERITDGCDDLTVVNPDPASSSIPLKSFRAIKPGYVYLDRYTVRDQLGKGSMGVVYRCHDEVAGIDVALKAIPPELSRDTVKMEAIRANFQLVHRLHHPGIANANTLEKDQETGDYFLIMECVDGVNLMAHYKSRGYHPSLTMALPVLRQIAEALDYAHGQNIIHRDIKPSNVQITDEGVVKILDFGLAQQIQSSILRITGAEDSKGGTPYFMAPEQWKGQFQDAATDQYAFAILTYQLIAGKCPFQSPDIMVLREMVLNEKPPKPESLTEVEWKVLRKAMEKERIARYISCTELVETLENAAKVSSSSRAQVPTGEDGPGGQSTRPKAARNTWVKRKYRPPARVLGTRRMLVGVFLFPLLACGIAGAGALSWSRIHADARARKSAYVAARKSAIAAVKARDWERALHFSNKALETGSRDPRDALKLQMVVNKAASPRAGTLRVVPLAEGVNIELVWIPPGTYLQGSFFAGHYDEEPAHRVMIPRGFWMGKYEVTQVQYAGVTGQNPSQHIGKTHPVDSISRKEAGAFVRAISKEDLSFRLPTEAEWEYACRAGRQAPYYFGSRASDLNRYANYADASNASTLIDWRDTEHSDGFNRTSPAGSFNPNAWGLYDMAGNVAEWCDDLYHRYQFSPYPDKATGKEHVARGGSWASAAAYCRSASRKEFRSVDASLGTTGFRVVLDKEQGDPALGGPLLPDIINE